MSDLPPELIATIKKFAMAAMGETAKHIATKIHGIEDPTIAYKIIQELMPRLPGAALPVLLVEKYVVINILGRAKVISNDLYTGLLKEINPMQELGLVV